MSPTSSWMASPRWHGTGGGGDCRIAAPAGRRRLQSVTGAESRFVLPWQCQTRISGRTGEGRRDGVVPPAGKAPDCKGAAV